MANNTFSISADIYDVQEALSKTSKNLKSISRKTLQVIAKGTAKRIKAVINASDLQDRTGELKKAFVYKIKKNGEEANVFPKALNGNRNIFPKVMTLSYGHEGPTKRASSYTIKPRGFVQAGDLYVERGDYQPEIQKLIDKELEKYWGND